MLKNRHSQNLSTKYWTSLLRRNCSESRTYSHKPITNSLRILYCGSDDFSAVSLRALNDYRLRSDHIAKLDVLCKEGKPSGRGRKQIRDGEHGHSSIYIKLIEYSVPLKAVAQELSLNCHEIPTFTGWAPPEPANLIIAVSFGLKIPRRILESSAHGGLNLHPSLLPE